MKMIGLRIAVLLFALLYYSSCERRPLEEDIYETALIPISIDWSKSGIPQGEDGRYEIHRASILFYPKDGGEMLEYLLEADINYREIEVPVGSYSVMIFNETRTPGDWANIYFTGIDRYHTFAAYTRPEEQVGFYLRATEPTLCKQPEPLAVWSLDHFEVTADMVGTTEAGGKTRNKLGSSEVKNPFIDVTPLPRSKRVLVRVRVLNLTSAIQSTGIVRGAVAGVMMASGETINILASHAVLLNGRQMEENGKDGTIGALMYVFGVKENEVCTFQTDFLLTDGRLYSPPPTTGKDLFKPQDEGANSDYLIDIGVGTSETPKPGEPEQEPDFPPIQLPDTGTNADVEVGSWDEVIIPMN